MNMSAMACEESENVTDDKTETISENNLEVSQFSHRTHLGKQSKISHF